MNANKYVSKSEHILLVLVAFVLFTFISSVLILDVINSYNYAVLEGQRNLMSHANGEPIIRFSGGSGQMMPGFHILSLFVFVALFRSKRFIVSLFFTIFYSTILIYEIGLRYDYGLLGGEVYLPKLDFIQKLYRGADPFDYIIALFLLILLLWHSSIFIRVFHKFVHRKNKLV